MSESQEPESPAEADNQAKGGKKIRPIKILPTDRINFSKQLDILRAFVAASGPSGKVVRNKEVADLVKMMETTISLANSFFTDIGFLRRGDGGFVPAQEVVNYVRAFEWNPENASHKLQPLVAASWFSQALMPKASFRPLEETEAIAVLAEAASAAPAYKNQLKTLIDYMEAAGLVLRDGTQIKSRGPQQAQPASGERGPSTERLESPPSPKGTVVSAFSQAPEGVVQFHVSVKVDMKEFSGWQSDRIAAFFAGIAQVLAAKGAIEKGGAGQD
jgi:hypothetical protein